MGGAASLDVVSASLEEDGALVKYILEPAFAHLIIAGFIEAFQKDPKRVRSLVDTIRLEMNAPLSRMREERKVNDGEAGDEQLQVDEKRLPEVYVRGKELDAAHAQISVLQAEVAALRQNPLLSNRIPGSLIVCQAKAARDAAVMHASPVFTLQFGVWFLSFLGFSARLRHCVRSV